MIDSMSTLISERTDDIKTDKCTWCKGDGYFGDFGPGLYPLPCPHCAGIGIEGIISEDISKHLLETRKEFYHLIKSQTERLEVASTSFEIGIRLFLAESFEEREKYENQRQLFLQKLNTFPTFYLQIEKYCLEEGWKRAKQLVDPQYKDIVEQNSRKVVGKTYIENARLELESYKLREKNTA